MLELAASAEPGRPDRLLINRKTFTWALKTFRPAMLSNIRWALRSFGGRAIVLDLWRKVFGEIPEHTLCCDPEELAWRLAEKVSSELFPINMQSIYELYNSGQFDDPEEGGPSGTFLDYELPFDSASVPWEVFGFGDVPEEYQAAFACIHPVMMETASGWVGVAEAGPAEDAAIDWIDTFFDRLSVDPPDPGFWEQPEGSFQSLRVLREALALLPPPLDGLEVVTYLLARDGGNPWLDYPANFRFEYWDMGFDEYGWTEGDIHILAELYKQAKPQLDRLKAYRGWFECRPNTDDRHRQVIEIFRHLMEGNWEIRDGELIWTDGTEEWLNEIAPGGKTLVQIFTEEDHD